MPSGYEKSPDYGAPPPSPLYIRLGALAFLVAAGVIAWNMWPAPHDCRHVPASEIEAIDGKAVLRLDKLNLKPGECVTIAP
ncbi:MAG: hypothetical protein ACKVP4_02700 [Hyphomicrobium sp.]